MMDFCYQIVATRDLDRPETLILCGFQDFSLYSHSTRYFCEYLNLIIHTLITYLYLFIFLLIHIFSDFFSIKTVSHVILQKL